MSKGKYRIGMVGLGVMGRNLLLNMADHGFSVAGYDTDPAKVQALKQEAEHRDIQGAGTVKEFINLLSEPHVVMMLIPAGPPVDAVIREILPDLSTGDILIDGGNSHFRDTDLRQNALADKGIDFLGIGISGGEYGARHGPSIMPGGRREAYEKVREVFEAVSAKVDQDPCAAYLGPGSAGHYVKMVHNGIEYGLIQLIAESYDLMKRGLGMNDDELHDVYDRWNKGDLNAYLVEITADIFRRVDEKTGKRLIDVILDQAGQKGTGMWTSEEGMELQVPIPTIDIAVSMRDLSGLRSERVTAGSCLPGPGCLLQVDRKGFLEHLAGAIEAGMILTYIQGMALLRKGSEVHQYRLDLETIAGIWRGGCIIRSEFLEKILGAFHAQPNLPNLLIDPYFSNEVMMRQKMLRTVITQGAEVGIPIPALMTALAYFDSYRSVWLPANLIQAQRDYFGSHTYERIDAKGVFHTHWHEE
jgi:6-phosphogluconate dehydrogenase